MVRKRDDGRWEGRIVVGHKEDGDPIFQYVLAPTQKALLAKLHQNIEVFRGVELCEDSRMTLAQWLDRWLDEYAFPRLRESTMDGYRMYAEQYIKPRLGNKKMNSITATDIQRMYTKLKKEGRVREHPEHGRALSASTVRRIHTMLHRALEDAVKAHIIPRNPAEGLTLPRSDGPTKHVLTDRELDKFMEVIKADPFWHDFFYTELTTGLRRGEICALQWAIIFISLHRNNKSNNVFLIFCWKPQKFASCNKDTYTPISFRHINKFTESFLIYLARFYNKPDRCFSTRGTVADNFCKQYIICNKRFFDVFYKLFVKLAQHPQEVQPSIL